MMLEDWVKQQVQAAAEAGQKVSFRSVVESLADKAGVAYMTLAPVAKGGRLSRYEKARAVSQATDWKVTIPELCGDVALTGPTHDQFTALVQVIRGQE